MKNRKRMTFASLVLIASILACNTPAPEQVPPPSDRQTAAAQTVEALLAPTITATVHQAAATSLPASPTPSVGSTGTITPTYSVPMLRVLQQTNCRTGPGQDYQVIFTYLPWKELEIVGAYPQENYWLVKSDESATGTCWLWGEYVEVTGSYWAVASVTPPPTASPAPPAPPSIQEWDFRCNVGQVTVNIKWTDRAVNESGYRVIRDEEVAAELPADSNSYAETIPYESGDKFIYFIEVYNVTGPVRSTSMQFTCP